MSANGVEFATDEPTVALVAKEFDPELQVPVSAEKTVARASVLNFRSPGMLIDPINHEVFEIKREVTDPPDVDTGVDFDSQSFVVDMMGGQRMPYSSADKTYYAPSEMIVMDIDGNIQVRDALDDHTEYRHALFKEDESLSDAQPKKPSQPANESGQNRFSPGAARK